MTPADPIWWIIRSDNSFFASPFSGWWQLIKSFVCFSLISSKTCQLQRGSATEERCVVTSSAMLGADGELAWTAPALNVGPRCVCACTQTRRRGDSVHISIHIKRQSYLTHTFHKNTRTETQPFFEIHALSELCNAANFAIAYSNRIYWSTHENVYIRESSLQHGVMFWDTSLGENVQRFHIKTFIVRMNFHEALKKSRIDVEMWRAELL